MSALDIGPEYRGLRMKYAGVLKLLEECSVQVDEETRDMIEMAFNDAASTGRFNWRRVLNRIEIEVAT